MKTKLRKNEFLFFLSYIILYVSLFIGDVYNLNGFDAFAKNLRLCSYALILFSCINLKFRKKEFMQLIAVFMLTLFYGIITGDLYWSILILLIYNAKNIDIKSIYRISSRILVIGIVVVLTFCVIGILPDILTTRNTIEQVNFDRHSFGFYHSNVLPLLIFYLEVYYVCITKEKANNTTIALFMFLAIVANVFCNSRNAVISSIFLSVFIILEKKRSRNNHRLLYRTAIFSIPCMSVFSFAMMFLLLKGGIWDTIDSVFSGRFRLAIFKMRRIGIHLINIMSNEIFASDNIVYVNGENLSSVTLDNGYLYIILRYGILILLFYFLVAYLLAKKNKDNGCVLVTIIAVFIINFVDNDLVDYSFLPFILWAFNDRTDNNIVKNIKEKFDGMFKGKRAKT